MKYKNPIIKGFYPDPSVCEANGKIYLVSSSFQFFPGVPIFESEDLVNWRQIGNVLTRKDQVELDGINSSGGVFAPSIRFHNGRFYMVTTNDTTHRNFYVFTDDIYGEWSDPITVDQGGIDPSLLFDDEHVYFVSNGFDDYGESGVVQCEINISTGEKLSASKCIWKGSGGRYLESPHMYKIDGLYYLMAAEGGTEYGHMITYARSENVWGPFQDYACNPVLTNRNKAPNIIQGIGHGELIQNKNGEWFIVSLGFRQIHIWQPYHHLGREVFLTPIQFDKDGWFKAGVDGTTDDEYEIQGDFCQNNQAVYTFENTDFQIEWLYLRHPNRENYQLTRDFVRLKGTNITLEDCASPTFIGLRQRDFNMKTCCTVDCEAGEGGLSLYMCENEHYDLAIRSIEGEKQVVLKLNIGNIKHVECVHKLTTSKVALVIRSNSQKYVFYVKENEKEIYLGEALSKYLSSEVSGGFTGVIVALYAVNGESTFSEFQIEYFDENDLVESDEKKIV